MKKVSQIIFVILLGLTSTLQLAARETGQERFKQKLLEQIKREMTNISDTEIQSIIEAVDKQLTDYIERYEQTPKDQLLTKEELYLEQHKDEVALQKFSMMQADSGKSSNCKRNAGQPKLVEGRCSTCDELTGAQTQVILEELNPRLKMMGEDAYRYNENTRELEFTMNKDAMFNKKSDDLTQVSNEGLAFLKKGDVLINLDNGSSSGLFKWGHAALMYRKATTPDLSRTIEAPGPGKKVQLVNYQKAWHANKRNRIAYNYVPRVYGTNKPARAADNALRYMAKAYGLYPVLGDTRTIYCTELVFLAYMSQGVNLGNGMKMGSWGILLPRSMYCDDDLAPYYRQNFVGGVC